MPEAPILTIIAHAPPAEVERLLRAELSPDEFALVQIAPHRSDTDPFGTRPSHEFGVIAESAITFLAKAAASGIAWDIMKKIYTILLEKPKSITPDKNDTRAEE